MCPSSLQKHLSDRDRISSLAQGLRASSVLTEEAASTSISVAAATTLTPTIVRGVTRGQGYYSLSLLASSLTTVIMNHVSAVSGIHQRNLNTASEVNYFLKKSTVQSRLFTILHRIHMFYDK